MMLFFFSLLTLINSIADSKKFIFKYRLDIGAYPISILDALMVILALLSLRAMSQPKLDGERTPRAYFYVTGTIVVAIFCGVGMGFMNNVAPREIVMMARNVLNLLLGIVIGFYTIQTPGQARFAGYLIMVGSVGSALAILFNIGGLTDDLSNIHQSFDRLRIVSAGGDAGLATAAAICFGLVARVRILPLWLALLVLPVVVTGAFSLPHRSSWVMAALTLLFTMLVLPRVPLFRRAGVTALTGLVLVVVLVLAVGLYSRTTGRDFNQWIGQRLSTLLPGQEDSSQPKAWDSRLGPAMYELGLWTRSPIMGLGYGVQASEAEHLGIDGYGFRHNVWTSQLCEAGIPGLMSFLLPPVLCMVVGFRVVKARTDPGTLLIGVLAAAQGCSAFLLAGMTASINQQRAAIPLGILCGLVLRARAMQLATIEAYAGYDLNLADDAGWGDDAAATGHPV